MLKKFLAIVAMLFATAMAMAAVDVNKATEAELDSVKGIGPGTSKMILDERRKGEFKSWDDFVTRVKGVGDKRAENLSAAGLTVGGKAFKPATTGAPAKKADAKVDLKAEAKADGKAAKAEKAEAKAEKKEARAEARKDDKPSAAAKPAGAASAAKK